MASVFSVLYEKIGDDVRALEQVLRDDRIKNMEHYREITGQLRGLTTALQYVKDLEIKVEHDDWED